MSDHEEQGATEQQLLRSFTVEFKAEIEPPPRPPVGQTAGASI
jgi:hypothetical protein